MKRLIIHFTMVLALGLATPLAGQQRISTDSIRPQRSCSGFFKEQRDSHLARRFKTVDIINQHGPITVSAWNVDTIAVEVVVSVATTNEEIATQILDKINIATASNSQTLIYRTQVGDDISYNHPFTIEYQVYMPAEGGLKIKNQFGDVSLNSLMGSIEMELTYGNLLHTGIEPVARLQSKLVFADATLGSLLNADLNLSNAQVTIKQASDLNISGAFCRSKIDRAGRLTMNVSTGRFMIGSVDSLFIKGNHLFPSIDEIHYKGKIEMTNGLILIKKVSRQLESLTVSNQNAPLNLSLPAQLNYTLQGEVRNGYFRHFDANRFQVIHDGPVTSFSGFTGENEKRATLILFNRKADINIYEQ